MTTYTIAFGDLLYAVVRDGEDIDAAVAAEGAKIGETIVDYRTETGLTLTNDEPEDGEGIVWRGHRMGCLFDESGQEFEFAVRAA